MAVFLTLLSLLLEMPLKKRGVVEKGVVQDVVAGSRKQAVRLTTQPSWVVCELPLRYLVFQGMNTFKDTGLQKGREKSPVFFKPIIPQDTS